MPIFYFDVYWTSDCDGLHSGYTNWKELVRPLADDIGLDVEKENDLVAITQYYRNERGTRSSINQKILRNR